ncbi:helix-turn-helix domain-containing protein [Methanoregula sp.]|uniref:helix-turn-helix domain-containing protein n=1 Tax=Methanoregula sp. TaxID=2052170 RepID=UPI002374AE65|nr:helix-turn-helix domain-containing protein [Methanoregula sp.]MDD1685685.1 helix-turn-helix domain-containing protein [Methanoregula sp.]
MDENTQLLNPKQVAEILGVHQKTVHLWLRSGKLEGTKISYRAWRIPKAALDSFITRNTNIRSLQHTRLPMGNNQELTTTIKSPNQQNETHSAEKENNDASPQVRMKHYIQDIMGEQPPKK